jgi:hypothetical protein
MTLKVLKNGKKIARCNRCNTIILESELPQYSGQCLKCDEDLYAHEFYWDKFNLGAMDELIRLSKDLQTD